MSHAAHHALAALAIFRAGAAFTYRRRLGWAALAGYAVTRCHLDHHRRTA